MLPVMILLATGSFVIALLLTWQVKYITPDLISIARYNLYILPFIFLGNTSLGMGFVRGHKLIDNLPLLIALQSFTYYIFIVALSILLLGDKITVYRGLLGFGLIALGVLVLKS